MKIMGLGAGKEGQMVAGVGVEGGEDGQGEPEPGGGHVTAHEKDAHEGGQQVAEDVLDGMAIDRRDRDGGRPLVVLLVDVLVDVLVVEEAMGVVEAELLHQDADGQLEADPVERGQVPDVAQAPDLHQSVAGIGQGQAHEYLIADHAPNHLKSETKRSIKRSHRRQLYDRYDKVIPSRAVALRRAHWCPVGSCICGDRRACWSGP